MAKDNYEFFMSENVDQYAGKWIVICDKKIVSSGEKFQEVFAQAKQVCPQSKPFVTKVAEKETMIF